jgi:hypothetical protein
MATAPVHQNINIEGGGQLIRISFVAGQSNITIQLGEKPREIAEAPKPAAAPQPKGIPLAAWVLVAFIIVGMVSGGAIAFFTLTVTEAVMTTVATTLLTTTLGLIPKLIDILK